MIRIVGLVLVVLVVAVGCSGDSGGDATEGDTFVADVDLVCVDLREELATLEAAQVPIDPDADPAELSEPLEQAAAAYDTAIAELRDLDPPEALQGSYDRFMAALEDLAGASRQMAEAAADGDRDAMSELAADSPDGSDDLRSIAAEIGLTCFEPDTPSSNAGSDVEAFCADAAEFVEAVDSYVADPTSADSLTLSTEGLDLSERYADMAADASPEDAVALRDCVDGVVDAALDLADAAAG